MLRTEISSNIARTDQKENCGKHTLHTNRSVRSVVVPTEEHTPLYCTTQIFRISFPTIITCAFMQLTYFINTVYAGKLDELRDLFSEYGLIRLRVLVDSVDRVKAWINFSVVRRLR